MASAVSMNSLTTANKLIFLAAALAKGTSTMSSIFSLFAVDFYASISGSTLIYSRFVVVKNGIRNRQLIVYFQSYL